MPPDVLAPTQGVFRVVVSGQVPDRIVPAPRGLGVGQDVEGFVLASDAFGSGWGVKLVVAPDSVIVVEFEEGSGVGSGTKPLADFDVGIRGADRWGKSATWENVQCRC